MTMMMMMVMMVMMMMMMVMMHCKARQGKALLCTHDQSGSVLLHHKEGLYAVTTERCYRYTICC